MRRWRAGDVAGGLSRFPPQVLVGFYGVYVTVNLGDKLRYNIITLSLRFCDDDVIIYGTVIVKHI